MLPLLLPTLRLLHRVGVLFMFPLRLLDQICDGLRTFGQRDQIVEELERREFHASMKEDLQLAYKRTHLPQGDGQYKASCWPYVAGAQLCGELREVRTHNSGQYQRGLPESMYSGFVAKQVVVDELACVGAARGSKSGCSGILKLGTLNGQTFTSHGWGFGLLQHDLLPQFLLNMFSFSAHGAASRLANTPVNLNVRV